jgi:hypothetical protein
LWKILEERSKEKANIFPTCRDDRKIQSLVSIDYLNMNFSSENGAVKELLDPTRTNRLDIVNILNETSRSRDVNQDV